MGKITGFLDYQRKEDNEIEASERIKNYKEFHTTLKEEERIEQAGRCMNCGVPFCQSAIKLKGMVTGCPLHNLIPEWNDEIYNKNYSFGLSRLLKTNPFPEFTGRVCPALCEKACICGQQGDSVTVRYNELFLIETGYANNQVVGKQPQIRTNKRIAVVGSGPAGLSTATNLNTQGHNVTVFERDDRIGGLLMYGIPNMKLDKSVIARRQKVLEDSGIEFRVNTNIGKDITFEQLEKDFDAIVVCCGAKKARSIPAFTQSDENVFFAVDYLTQATKGILNGQEVSSLYNAQGKNVVIIGGGDSGNDCVGTAIRQGCKSVLQIEMMKKPPTERLASNPWPEWPKTLKTDYGQLEAIEVFGADPRVFSTTVKSCLRDGNTIKKLETIEVDFVDGKLQEVEGTNKIIDCDMAIVAAGFVGCEDYVAQPLGLTRNKINNFLSTGEGYATSNRKVFIAGDARRGQSLVVWAIQEGIKCAQEVDAFLKN